jgi:hypothetical protein
MKNGAPSVNTCVIMSNLNIIQHLKESGVGQELASNNQEASKQLLQQ